MDFGDIFKGFKDSAETKVTGYVVNQVAKYVNTLLEEHLDVWIRESLTSVGRILQQAGGALADFPIVETKYNFLGKKQSKDIKTLLKSYYDLSKGVPGGYSAFVTDCYNKLNNYLDGYIQCINRIKEEACSLKDLYKIKKDLTTCLTTIKDFSEGSGYKDNTVSKIIELSEENIKEKEVKGEAEKKEEFKTGTLGDFIGMVFIPLLNSSLKNLEENKHGECAIYIGKEEEKGFKLDFNKLGLSTQKTTLNNGKPETKYKGEVINAHINEGNKDYLEKLKSYSEKIYKEAEKIKKEIDKNNLKIISKISKNMLSDDRERYGINRLDKEYSEIKELVSDELNELKKLKDSIIKDDNVASVYSLYEKVNSYIKLIRENYQKSLSIYDKIFDCIDNFVPYISEINKWKRDIEKWIDVISWSELFSDEVKRALINSHVKYFNVFYNTNEIDKNTDLVGGLKKAKQYYNIISELYKIVSNEKIFNGCYKKINDLGFEKYGESIKKEFNKSIEKILSKDIEKNITINVNTELKKLKENVSLVERCAKVYKDLELLRKNIENTNYDDAKSEADEYLKSKPKRINVLNSKESIKCEITKVEGEISLIKSMLSKTERITLKASFFKDKIKSKLGMDSKNKDGKGKEEDNSGVKKK